MSEAADAQPNWIDGPPERIVVFRAHMLGEMLCAVPALRALRAAFASAEITLVGLPWARPLAQRLSCVDDFIEFPGHPGMDAAPCDVRVLPDFLAQVQARRFDLAIQLHGSGEIANPIVASFGAQQNAGFAAPSSWTPGADAGLFCAWPEHGHEVERLLALIDHLRLPRSGAQLEFPLADADREALLAEWPGATSKRPYVCVHAAAQPAAQGWDPRRMAEAADALARRGRTIVLSGSALDASLATDIAACMHHTPVDLSGRTTVWTLGALIEGAESLISNDAGMTHVAAALGRPSAVVDCSADVPRAEQADSVTA